MDKHHPVLERLLALGCKNQGKVAVAFQVYIELSEIVALWDVNYDYNEELDVIYFTGRKSKSAPLEIFVPFNAKSGLSFNDIYMLQDKLCHGKDSKLITLAVKEQDSTVLLYSLTQGLVLPESPEETQRKKRISEQHIRLQSELRKNREGIFMRTQDINSSNQVETDDSTGMQHMEHDMHVLKEESEIENKTDEFSEEL